MSIGIEGNDESSDGVDAMIEAFWNAARVRAKVSEPGALAGATALEAVRPPAWAFGAGSEQADELLSLVLDGTKTASAGALWSYEFDGEAPPAVGDLSIILDGAGRPRALIVVERVDIVPFNQVDAEHAEAEGEGDRELQYWRAEHRRFFTEHASHDRGFRDDMPVVLERFKVLFSN